MSEVLDDGEKVDSEQTTQVAFKGFDAGLKCRGFQYEVGKTYSVEGAIAACENGFHACVEPFDVFNYYLVGDDGALARFCEVEQSGELSRHGEDSKIASARIKIVTELSFSRFVAHAVGVLVNRLAGITGSSGDSVRIGLSGDSAQIGSSGNNAQIGSSGVNARIGSAGDTARIGSSGHHAQIGSSGHHAQIGSSGYFAQIGSSGSAVQIGSSGDHAQIGSSGDHAQIGSSGDDARIGSSGDHAQIGSSGDDAQIGSSGDDARIGSSGYGVIISVEGSNAVVASAGVGTRVRGRAGTWVALAEFSGGRCVGFACGQLPKDNVAYRARNGELVEAGSV